MGEVKVGTTVIGADGKACRVIGVFPKGVKDVYRVEFNDGTYVDCGLEHLWEVQTRTDRVKHNPPRIVNTKQMLENFELKRNKGKRRNYSIRMVKPVEFENKLEKDDIDPYLLGCLIGNGSLKSSQIRITCNDEEIIENIKRVLPKGTEIVKYTQEFQYGIKRICRNGMKTNPIVDKLKEYGLIDKKSFEKFIPTKYLYSSVENRLKLLRGLMDTDGNVEQGTGARYTTTSEKLKDNIVELARSLGAKVSNWIEEPKVSYINGRKIKTSRIAHRIRINMLENPFELKRKREKFNSISKNYQKIVTDITKVRQEECQCIMVDHSEHLYVTDGYTLTHNTEVSKRFLAWSLGNNPDSPSMFVSYSAAIAKDKGFIGIDALVNDDMGNYSKIFPKLHELYRSAQDMVLDFSNDSNRKRAHSEYSMYFVGFDGSITGRTRAHNILYADDLVKDIEEASNKDIMDKKWVEFTGTLKKRMQGRCKMLLVGTMFSINDPLTRTINYYREHEPERLIEIRIPGLNENDESNFNYKYGFAITTEMFHEDRDLMDPVSFSCLIQQNPIERAGLLFFEEEFKKFDLSTYKRNEEEYQRTVAYCDVAWGGEDHLSMPIVDEYKNGDCPAVHWIFLKGSKDETIPQVVDAIITYGVTYVCFEANNGGDMYAEAVEKELKKKKYVCYVTSAKAPTNKTKLDRILAAQGFIKGVDSSEYRLIIPIRESIKGDKQFNEALNEVFAFNQSTAKNVRAKQHDDAPDSAAGLAANVLGVNAKIGRVTSTISREMLGI